MNARVIDSNGHDVTRHFVAGAERTPELARSDEVRIAVLKEGSPSCGSGYTYDGTFTGTRVPSPGVTTAVLQPAGVYVFNEHQLDEAEALLKELESVPLRDRDDR